MSIIYAKVLLFDGPCKRSRNADSPGAKLSRPFNGFARYEALAVGSSRGLAPVREEKSGSLSDTGQRRRATRRRKS